ncbi:SRPBCC family protein [Caulobacter sp. RHG1]|uniref:SRPBCC family protein n=1 Tax=Caulobacter sp. (strain RHG1) TaxID=2545762 RepID=UPI0015575D26|nr:SRPBCC family protein [Caulobacter sp. RHG1]NQE61448.1 hypothetical protein [Caulobacter sp. RHG1]
MTLKISFSTDIPAPIAEVWRRLIDFDRWGEWHPHRSLVGKAQLRARVVHVTPRAHALRRKTPCRIDVLEDERCLSFKFGRWLTGYSFERFELTPSKTGTRLTQVAVVPSWTAALNGGRERYEASVKEAYRQSASGLTRHLGGARPVKRRAIPKTRSRL